MVNFNEDKQNLKIQELRLKNAEESAKHKAEKLGLPYIDLNLSPVNMDVFRYVSEKESRKAKVAAFDKLGKKIKLGVLSPESIDTKNFIENLESKNFSVSIYVVSESSLEKVWERYKDLSKASETKGGVIQISQNEIENIIQSKLKIEDVGALIENLINEKENYKISKALEIILGGAITTKASDIHMEPEENFVRIRYRLDGILTNVIDISYKIYNPIISRIKLISRLKINKAGVPQDGRFSIKAGEDEIEIRVSIIPGAYSETVVMRILNPNAISVNLEELGMHEKVLQIMKKEIRRPNGMILNTGPTGSGKTTTLYAFLKQIYSPDIKIITIENPVEYHLPGIVQTQVNKKEGYTFSSGLRSALRQDPDIIMVGEIRDKKTAETAIHAALTGHLVFSTLHTNTAAGTFPRLIDMGINPKIISSALAVSMAQRLVRKLCENCKTEKDIDPEEKEKVDKIVESIKDKSYLEDIETNRSWISKGCDKCNHSGFRGRIGIYEIILTNENIEKIIRENPSEREISEEAENQNMLNMKQDGVIKVLKGITSIEELERVIDLRDN